MRCESAISLVENLVYKPEWTIEASCHCHRFEECVCLKVTYPAHESSREMAKEGYPQDNEPRASFPIMVQNLDDIGLYREIIKVLMEIEEHEAREFLRVNPTFWAPFHPHQTDGMQRWGNVEKDLTFGVV